MSDIVNSSLKTAVKGTAKVFLGMVISILLWFATKILIIRNTTQEELGVYSLVVAIIGIFSLLGTLGLHEGIARYISLFRGQSKKDTANAFSRDALKLGILSSFCIFVILLLFSGVISKYIFYKPELEYPLQIISFYIPLYVITTIMIGMLRGHNFVESRAYAEASQPLFFLILLSISFGFHSTFISIIYAYVFSMAAVFFFIYAYGIKKTGLIFSSVKSDNKKIELLKFSLPLLMVSMLTILFSSTDTLMLGRYMLSKDVGLYNVSISLARLLTFPLSALGFVFMPISGEMYARGQLSELRRTYQVLTKWVFSATFPIFFILFFFSEMMITFLFGGKFAASSTSLRILSVGFLMNSFLGINALLMIVIGRSRTLMNINILGTFLNILINYVMIKHFQFGIIGAALATATSSVILNSVTAIVLFRESGIHPFTPEYIKPVICSAFIGIMIYVIAKSLPLYLWMMPFYLIVFIAGYAMSLRITRSLDREDIFLFKTILGKMGIKR